MPSSPMSGSMFDEDWTLFADCDMLQGLGPIEDFNASFGDVSRNIVDPQLLGALSDGTSTYDAAGSIAALDNTCDEQNDDFTEVAKAMIHDDGNYMFTAHQKLGAPANGLHPNPDGDAPSYEDNLPPQYHPNRHGLHQSIELAADSASMYTEQIYQGGHHARFHMRRSISEPPMGEDPDSLFLPYQQQPIPTVSFRRANYSIGTPTSQPRSLGKHKTPTRSLRQRNLRPHLSAAKSYEQNLSRRPEMKRACKRSSKAPTSMRGSPRRANEDMRGQELVGMSPFPHMSTRVCTPTPPPEQMTSSAVSYSGQADDGLTIAEDALMMPVTREQLQALIDNAVRKALEAERG